MGRNSISGLWLYTYSVKYSPMKIDGQFRDLRRELGFPGSSDGKEYACKAGHLGLIPGLGRSPREENGNPLQYSCLENSMERGACGLQYMRSQRVRHDSATDKEGVNGFDQLKIISCSFSSAMALWVEFGWVSWNHFQSFDLAEIGQITIRFSNRTHYRLMHFCFTPLETESYRYQVCLWALFLSLQQVTWMGDKLFILPSKLLFSCTILLFGGWKGVFHSEYMLLLLFNYSVMSDCDPMDCSPPGFSVLQARILEWVAISFSRGSSQPRDRTYVSCIGRWILYQWATREAHSEHLWGIKMMWSDNLIWHVQILGNVPDKFFFR